MWTVWFRKAEQEKEKGNDAFRCQEKPPNLTALRVFQQHQRNHCREQHANRLACNRSDHHSRTTAFRQYFRNVTATRWEIDADSHPNEKLADKEHWESIGQRAGRGADSDDYHVGKHQLLSAKMICHRPAESGTEDSTKYQTRPDETYHFGSEMKFNGDQWHRHAENEAYKAINQWASGRAHPKPSLDW